MTKKRYFYDCALKAAYMAKEYGMRFHADGFEEPTNAPPEELATWGEGPIYIHPGSLHLLEVMEGDIVVPSYGWRPKQAQWWDVEQIKSGEKTSFKRGYRIICRHRSKLFFWPESEEA